MKNHLALLSLILSVSIISCERDIPDIIDIFAVEELTDPVHLRLGDDPGLDILMVNSDRIIEIPGGFHIKGTIFSKSMSGIIPVTSGDFIIKGDMLSSMKSLGSLEFKGYGTANFPSVDLFSASEIDEVPGSEVYYNTGTIFKEESYAKELPLFDNRYYFRYKVDNAGKSREYRMKKLTVKLREFYLDARDPATIFAGDIYSEPKPGIKNLIVEQGVAGISANELWSFTPFTYSDHLETVTGGTGFEPMNGGITLSGVIPIKKYPLKILGKAVINTSFSSSGPLDLFERGFEDASFRIGVNGELFFTNKLVTFLTGTDTVKLGKATLQAEFSDDSFNLRMAGEYSDNLLDRLLGETMMKFIPVNSMSGIMYLRGSEDPDDFLVYIEENVSLQIPGMGVVPLSNSIFRVTKNEVGLSGSLNLPYGIGDVRVEGRLYADGSFILKGMAGCTVDLGAGLSFHSLLDVEVSEKGVKFLGTMTLPYGIGDTEVTGGLLIDEIYFSGKIQSDIPFPVDASIGSDLNLTISSKSGIYLSGSLDLPNGIGSVSVTGSLSADELLLSGEIGSGISINFGNVDVRTSTALSLTASSTTGLVIAGAVSLPFSLGDASVSARATGSGLVMTGTMGSKINISGYPLFSARLSVTASTSTGLRLTGSMLFPGNFG